MRFHSEHSEKRFDVQALETSERARARGLLDLLREAHADIREGVEPALLDRERAVQARLNVKTEQLVKVLGAKHTEAEATTAEQQIRATTDEYQAVRADIRARSPRYSALAYPEPLDVTDIQKQILDADTVLLEYILGGDQSYLWVVTPDAVVSHVLPPRREIEKLARRVYADWSTSVPPANTDAPAALSRLLLSPAELQSKRLLVVADGFLQYIPFAALPLPAAPHLPLAVQHEIVYLPSASILGILRRDRESRPAAPKLLGILADPVFDPNDPRVKFRGKPKLAPDSDPGLARPLFDRLRSTRREAEMLRSLVRSDNSNIALDFDANHSTVLNGEWMQYRILHIASHAFLNNTNPELSGIVLSTVDRSGRPQNGFLRMHELYNLKLGADLVVLSACQTALGQDIKGEGLVSLARGFMYAGATRVVASTWEVPEGATAELMRLFYKGMLRDRLSPAAALRAAQVNMSKSLSSNAPYYWAAFVLQGEYR
jgi:CHAT domain-containing protein